MRKILFGIVLWAALAFLPVPLIHAEEIGEFHDAVTINTNGTITVTERIDYDFGDTPRHGIFRTIPIVKKTQSGKDMRMTIGSVSARDNDGNRYPVSVAKSRTEVTVKVGDPAKTVEGKHTYVIEYVVSGALTYFSDHDELYWNVNGTQWTVPMSHVTADVSLPDRVPLESVRLACYTGPLGSTQSDCTSSYSAPVARFSTLTAFEPGENLTIVVGIPKEIVAVLEPMPMYSQLETVLGVIGMILLIIAGAFWYVALPIWIVIHWFQRGRDPKPTIGQAHVWFDVPKTQTLRPLSPGETGTLVDEQADLRDITATVIDLARRGFWKIEERKKNDFWLVRSTPREEETLQPFEQTLYTGLLGASDEVHVNGSDFTTDVSETKKGLYAAVVAEGFFSENPETVRTIYTVLGVVGLFTLNVPLAVSAFIYGRNMPRKTVIGSNAAAVARALKTFIESEERELTFQAKKQMFFEKFLPFAIAFGVEKIWAKRFADLRMHPPEWYTGYAAGPFNSVRFTQSIGSAASAIRSAATPTSSSSGFSSGFSGGSSGGGGGGGGGGSW